jgi:ankyrin repeat protein
MATLSVEDKLAIDLEILECARYGDDDDLRDLLVAGGNVNFKDGGGNTALHKGNHLYQSSGFPPLYLY